MNFLKIGEFWSRTMKRKLESTQIIYLELFINLTGGVRYK